MKQDVNILFEKFRIGECLKKDDFSAVYLAEHIFLEKQIILKVLDTTASDNENLTQRFKREARILASLDHPNIIKVLDFGTHGKHFYISFEYFKSGNLRELMKKGKITGEKFEKIVKQFLQGLHYIHNKGIIHRDIKPENILVNDSLELKLSDFGLAVSVKDKFTTGKLDLVGTPCYMSPEQIQGGKLTSASDIFSSGILFLEMLTGSNPFLGEQINQSINNIINLDEAEIVKLVEGLGENHSAMILKMLKKEPEERIFSKELLKQFGVSGEKTQGKRNRNLKFIMYVIVIIIPAALFILFVPEDKNVKENSRMDEQKKADSLIVSSGGEEESTLPEIKSLAEDNEKNNIPKVQSTESGEIEVKISEPAYGYLNIECYPWGKVLIDSVDYETTPLENPVKLKEGSYFVQLLHPDYPEFDTTISLAGDSVTLLDVNFNSRIGFFMCRIFPWGEIEIDGKFAGQTPLAEPLKLSPGNHKVKLINRNFESISDSIFITTSDTVFRNYRF